VGLIMKQTAIQQAIVLVRSRMESMNDTLMGKHTIHHLQQVERELYELLEAEKEQMIEFANSFYDDCGMQYGGLEKSAEEYYNETFNTETK
jgi:hypothetical protein